MSFRAINIAALTRTRKGEEGPASGLINTSSANFQTAHTAGQIVVQSPSAIVTGFGYAFLAAALLTGIGIIFTTLFIRQKTSSHKSTSDGGNHSSELEEA